MTTGDTPQDNSENTERTEFTFASAPNQAGRWSSVSSDERRRELDTERETLAEFEGELRAFRSELERQRSELDDAARAHNVRRTNLGLEIDDLTAAEHQLSQNRAEYDQAAKDLEDQLQTLVASRATTTAELNTFEQERVRLVAQRQEIQRPKI